MDYQFNIQLSYEQLLNLALQLPVVEQQKLIHTIKEKGLSDNFCGVG